MKRAGRLAANVDGSCAAAPNVNPQATRKKTQLRPGVRVLIMSSPLLECSWLYVSHLRQAARMIFARARRYPDVVRQTSSAA